MTEINEIIAEPSSNHTSPNDKCPFCPPPEDEGNYTTYPGKANDSKVLASLMLDPKQLGDTLQPGARPQKASFKNGHQQQQKNPKPRTPPKGKDYTFQAHHLISGNQGMKGEPFEDWIVHGAVIEKDTGYTINCTANGHWAPSLPIEYTVEHKGQWSRLDKDIRQVLAEYIMEKAQAQIHIGPHNITDHDDPDGKEHLSYAKYIKDKLEEISDRIWLWSMICYLCDKDDKNQKLQTTHHVHDILDRLSKHLKKEITGNSKTWRIFISRYALDYHKRQTFRKKKK